MFQHISHGNVFLLDVYLRYSWFGLIGVSQALHSAQRLRCTLPVTIHLKG